MPVNPKHKRLLYVEREPYWRSYTRKLIREGHSPGFIFVGGTRKGKSTGMYGIGRIVAHLLNKDNAKEYSIDNNFHFGVYDFMGAFDGAYQQVHIDDEAGEQLKGSKHYDPFNEAVASILETQAYRQNAVFFGLPVLKRMWEAHLEHIHMVFHVTHKYKGIGVANVYEVVVDHKEIAKLKTVRLRMMEKGVLLPKLTKEELDHFKEKEKKAKGDIWKKHLNKIRGDNEVDVLGDLVI